MYKLNMLASERVKAGKVSQTNVSKSHYTAYVVVTQI